MVRLYDVTMTLRIRNTLTRSVEPVEPLEPGRIRMYTCGPTVYRFAHVGNLRSYLLADLIRRVLLYHGLEVFHVKNITDVGHLREDQFDRGEDRMLVQAGLENKTSAEIADAYEAAFHADEALVNILPAHVFPRATEHIAEMVALAEELEDRGHAYASWRRQRVLRGRVVRRDTASSSGNSLEDLRAGPSRRGRGRQARPGRFRAMEGRRSAALAEMAHGALGRRVPGLAPRVLRDGTPLPRRPVRPAYGRHRQRLPPPRGRDRPVGAGRRRAAGHGSGSTGSTC